MPFIEFKSGRIHYREKGRGETVILLHGFTEDLRIWEKFSNRLSREFRVVCIDLCGHGRSGCVAPIHTMELQAAAVAAVLITLMINKCLMAGHSMGGYVTLAFAKKYPRYLKGICLFHSHCFPDSPADRKNRSRTIRVVQKDRFGFVASFIPGLFPSEVHKKFKKEIAELTGRAGKIPKEGIIAALRGMRGRRDQSPLLSSLKVPVLFILGLKDSKAPLQRLWEMVTLPAISETLILRDCGHMGYLEAPEITFSALRSFAKKIL